MPSFDPNLLPEFDSIRDIDETIYWTVRPKFLPFILAGFREGVFAIVFVAILFTMAPKIKIDPVNSNNWQLWVGVLPVVF